MFSYLEGESRWFPLSPSGKLFCDLLAVAETDSGIRWNGPTNGVCVPFDEMCDFALSEHDALLDTNDCQFALFDQPANRVFRHVEKFGSITHSVELKIALRLCHVTSR
jgi:hypothetical protein